MNFLRIDIGTSSICGIVYNTVSKDIVSIAKINNTDMLSCNVWEKVQDANAIVDIMLDYLGKCMVYCMLMLRGRLLVRYIHGKICVEVFFIKMV